MVSWLARQFRYFYRFLNTHDSPRQLACGCAFGILMGLLPKGNLLALFIGVLFFMLRVNLSVGMLTALLLSFVAGYVDPLSHWIGNYLLQAPGLQRTWTDLFNWPIVPWTRFNNTVVLGSFVLGVVLFYPVYSATFPLFSWWKNFQQKRRARAAKALEPEPSPLLLACRRQQFANFVAQVEFLSSRRAA